MSEAVKKNIKTAVIMAAGKGTRFGSRTSDMPKGFIPFKGKPMVERSVENLLDAGIERIIIGTGYHKEWYDRLAEKFPQIETVFSPRFAETNSMETLYRCKDAIGDDDFILLESDIVYEKKALSALLNDIHPDIMLVTPVTKFQDQYYIAIDDNHFLIGCNINKTNLIQEFGNEPYGELVGIHKISNSFYRDMAEVYEYNHRWHDIYQNEELPWKTGYEFILAKVATWQCIAATYIGNGDDFPSYPSGGLTSSRSLYVLKIENLQWYEIDDDRDLEFAEKNIQLSLQ